MSAPGCAYERRPALSNRFAPPPLPLEVGDRRLCQSTSPRSFRQPHAPGNVAITAPVILGPTLGFFVRSAPSGNGSGGGTREMILDLQFDAKYGLAAAAACVESLREYPNNVITEISPQDGMY